MRIPDPIANTTTEAYLAYKAGVLAEGDLKPKLYDPYIHLDAWLAYWAGLVATYPVDKNNDPEMLTDEEALIAYLSGVTNTYPEEFRDPADVRVAAYLKYLVSARWGRPEYPVTNEELYLSMMDAPYIPAGEPSSDIEIDDTAEAPFKDVKMYGDTSQATYTGKNLYNKDANTGAFRASKSVSGEEITITSTSAGNGYVAFVIPNSNDLLGKTCTISIKNITSSVSGTKGAFAIYQAKEAEPATVGGFVTNDQPTGQDYSKTFTFPGSFSGSSDCFAILLYPNNLGGSVAVGDNAKYSNIQIEAGSTATAYEPYVGGIPAPNPDYPQAVQTVTGENVVKICGKNLLDDSLYSTSTYSGTTSTIDGSTWSIIKNGNGGASLNPRTDYLPVNIPTGQTVSFTSYPVSGSVAASTVYYQIRVYFYDASKTLITNLSTATTATDIMAQQRTGTWTATQDVSYIRLGEYIPSNAGTTDGATLHLQLELGSATTYEPYQGQSYTVDLGSIELCKIGDYQDYIYKSDGKWYVHKEVGKCTFDGSENWFRSGRTTSAVFCAALDMANYIKILYGAKNSSKMDRFTFGSTAAIGNFDLYNGTTYAEYLVIMLDITSIPDVTAAKAWVASNKPEIYGVLATPTDTEITNTSLIDQLNALKNGGSYTGTTYIKVSATDPNLPGLLKVEAYKYD